MDIIVISDTHMMLDKLDLPFGDLLVHCGDGMNSGNVYDFNIFTEQIQNAAKQYRLGAIFVPGNHDKYVEAFPVMVKEMYEKINVKVLINDRVTIEGVNFYGSPYTPAFGHQWAFQLYGEDMAKHMWSKIPEDTDFLITHGMPNRILDKVDFFYKDENEYAGCKMLRRRIEEIKPRVYAGGHLHLNGGKVWHLNGTKYINAAVCDDQYIIRNDPIVVEDFYPT